MKKFNARRKFKAGIMMVQATNLLERRSFGTGRHSVMMAMKQSEVSKGYFLYRTPTELDRDH